MQPLLKIRISWFRSFPPRLSFVYFSFGFIDGIRLDVYRDCLVFNGVNSWKIEGVQIARISNTGDIWAIGLSERKGNISFEVKHSRSLASALRSTDFDEKYINEAPATPTNFGLKLLKSVFGLAIIGWLSIMLGAIVYALITNK
jgi:hypothetical protein